MARTIIITGSTRGIGEAAAAEFLRNGDNVTVFCRHQAHVDEVVGRLPDGNGAVLPQVGDVRRIDDVRRIVSATAAHFGRIDILVNNAGAAIWKPIEEHTEEEYRVVMETNVMGAWLFARETAPVMKEQGEGVMIQISSGLGERGGRNYSAYSPSKFALIGLTDVLADEIPDIRSYAVLPGGVHTKLHLDIHPWENGEDMLQPPRIGREIFTLAGSGEPSGSKRRVYE